MRKFNAEKSTQLHDMVCMTYANAATGAEPTTTTNTVAAWWPGLHYTAR